MYKEPAIMLASQKYSGLDIIPPISIKTSPAMPNKKAIQYLKATPTCAEVNVIVHDSENAIIAPTVKRTMPTQAINLRSGFILLMPLF